MLWLCLTDSTGNAQHSIGMITPSPRDESIKLDEINIFPSYA